jgi:biopolymer transport protein ExbD
MSIMKPASKPPLPEPIMEMNMTPLIDVMLVLIIMLIITIPKQFHSVNLTMPSLAGLEKPKTVTIDIDFDGTVLWDGVQVADRGELEHKLSTVAAATPPYAVMLRPNKLVAYKSVAGVMAMAQRARVNNLAVIGNEQLL